MQFNLPKVNIIGIIFLKTQRANMFKGYLTILNDLATPKLLNIMKVNCYYPRISLYILFIPNRIRNYISLPHICDPIALQLRMSSLSYEAQVKNILSILTPS